MDEWVCGEWVSYAETKKKNLKATEEEEEGDWTGSFSLAFHIRPTRLKCVPHPVDPAVAANQEAAPADTTQQ